jgi:NADH dehydrogenase
MKKKILIVGGGFGGIRTALDLAKSGDKNIQITLFSDKYHFEYYPTIYKAVIGKDPMEICIPLSEIFSEDSILGKRVDVVVDKIVEVNNSLKNIKGESGGIYEYDYLVLALGSETVYFNIPNLEESSFGIKSIVEAVRLRDHLEERFIEAKKSEIKEEQVKNLHILVVGAGPSGVELSAVLSKYLKEKAKEYGLDCNLPTIDLIESSPRILSALPEDLARKIDKRLRTLGVNIFTNRALVNNEDDEAQLRDMTMQTKTVIWTAGIKVNSFYRSIEGVEIAKNSRVEVDQYLQMKNVENVFIIGDAANTPYSGLAQTAIYDASFVARNILRKIKNKKLKIYEPKKVSYVIPVGPYWAAAKIGPMKIYGFLPHLLREFIDIMYFSSILPFGKVGKAFFSSFRKSKDCKDCKKCKKCD